MSRDGRTSALYEERTRPCEECTRKSSTSNCLPSCPYRHWHRRRRCRLSAPPSAARHRHRTCLGGGVPQSSAGGGRPNYRTHLDRDDGGRAHDVRRLCWRKGRAVERRGQPEHPRRPRTRSPVRTAPRHEAFVRVPTGTAVLCEYIDCVDIGRMVPWRAHSHNRLGQVALVAVKWTPAARKLAPARRRGRTVRGSVPRVIKLLILAQYECAQ